MRIDFVSDVACPWCAIGFNVLERGEFAEDVRDAERSWQELGIHSVPAVIVNRKHLISGGQPNAVFEQALRQIAAETDAAATS